MTNDYAQVALALLAVIFTVCVTAVGYFLGWLLKV